MKLHVSDFTILSSKMKKNDYESFNFLKPFVGAELGVDILRDI